MAFKKHQYIQGAIEKTNISATNWTPKKIAGGQSASRSSARAASFFPKSSFVNRYIPQAPKIDTKSAATRPASSGSLIRPMNKLPNQYCSGGFQSPYSASSDTNLYFAKLEWMA